MVGISCFILGRNKCTINLDFTHKVHLPTLTDLSPFSQLLDLRTVFLAPYIARDLAPGRLAHTITPPAGRNPPIPCVRSNPSLDAATPHPPPPTPAAYHTTSVPYTTLPRARTVRDGRTGTVVQP